jgi:decaprenylphospho-beta-D-erythro-pentofuranosid-2-ulose 2-reductase
MNTQNKTMLLVGATSDIGHETALAYAKAGWNVVLAARNPEAAERNRDNISTRTGATIVVHPFDVLDTQGFAPFIDALDRLPDTVVCVIGELGSQPLAETDPQHASMVIRTNFEGPALLLGLFAERFAGRGSGTIVGVSSVAGDRGRPSNYVYGAAKAGFTAFLSGLRARLAANSVRVLTVKPGFVRTRMTAGMKLPPLLTAEASEVAAAILRANESKRGADVLYVRKLWLPIMMAIKAVPEPIFKRLRL